MTEKACAILEMFAALSEDDRKDVAAEIMRRTAHLEYGSLDDETLSRLADELFVALDQEEAVDQ